MPARGGVKRRARFEKQQPKKKQRASNRCTTSGCPHRPRRLVVVRDRHKAALPYCVLCTNELLAQEMVVKAVAYESR